MATKRKKIKLPVRRRIPRKQRPAPASKRPSPKRPRSAGRNLKAITTGAQAMAQVAKVDPGGRKFDPLRLLFEACAGVTSKRERGTFRNPSHAASFMRGYVETLAGQVCALADTQALAAHRAAWRAGKQACTADGLPVLFESFRKQWAKGQRERDLRKPQFWELNRTF